MNCDFSIFIKYLLLFKSCLVLAHYAQLFEGLANTRFNLLLHSILKDSCSFDVIMISFRVLNFDVHECLVGFSYEYYAHVWCLRRSEQGVRPPGTVVMDSCELHVVHMVN